MEVFLKFVYVFLVGGALCMVGQVLVLKTKMTVARILVVFVSLGIILGAAGVFGIIRDHVGAGITVPIVGFGGVLAEGVIESVEQEGFAGIFMGGLSAVAMGVAAAVVFGLIVALIFKAKSK